MVCPNSGTKLAKMKFCIKVEKFCNTEISPKRPNMTVNSGTNESRDVKASDEATCIAFDR